MANIDITEREAGVIGNLIAIAFKNGGITIGDAQFLLEMFQKFSPLMPKPEENKVELDKKPN